MTLKISTEEAKIFVCDYYNLKGVGGEPNDWKLTKKYRNFKGVTCRDFKNEKNRVRAIVVAEVNSGESAPALKVIENEDYEFFLKIVKDLPLFYYVPVICNDGLMFIFESANHFEQLGKPSPHPEQHQLLLKKKLLSIFKEEDFFAVTHNLRFSFPNMEIEDIVRKLERAKVTFNPKLFDFLDERVYQPIMPDVDLASYLFPQDENLTNEEAIEIIFSMISQNENFTNEDYARVKFLLKKVREEEFATVRKIGLGFKKKLDKKLISIFDLEANRKKAQKLVKNIWLSQNK